MRFTRAAILSSDPVEAKDALCVAEFGSSFRTASWLDVTALYQAEVYSNHSFTISNPAVAHAIYANTSSGGYSYISGSGVQTVQVACVRSTAPLQFTRATESSSSDVSLKDALCVAELGNAYHTASWLDVTALYRSVFYSNHSFTVSNPTVAHAIYMNTSSSGSYGYISGSGVQTVQVACALR
jgi:hypothetical protein